MGDVVVEKDDHVGVEALHIERATGGCLREVGDRVLENLLGSQIGALFADLNLLRLDGVAVQGLAQFAAVNVEAALRGKTVEEIFG